MGNNIQLHKNDLPDDLDLGNIIAVDGEFMGLNVRRDPILITGKLNIDASIMPDEELPIIPLEFFNNSMNSDLS